MFSGKRRREVVNNFNLSVKPALELLGFEGESGYVTEDVDFLDTLYYLKNPERLITTPSEVSETIKKYSHLISHGLLNELEENQNRYEISFNALCSNDSQKATLCLKVINTEFGQFGKTIFLLAATISYFNKTNLRNIVESLFADIRNGEESKNFTEIWVIQNLPFDRHRDNVCFDIPCLFPSSENVNKDRLKQAQKILKNGYHL